MTNRHDELLELCAGYALGSLDAADEIRLDNHLATGCDECARALVDFREAASALAGAAPAAVPDPALRDRVSAAVGEAPEPLRAVAPAMVPPPAPASVVMFPTMAVVGWAAAAMLAIAFVWQRGAVDELGRELALVRGRQAELAAALNAEQGWSASMASPRARVANFESTPDGAQALGGWALYDPSTRRAVLVLENLELKPGQDFELWAIRDEGPRSLGVIEVKAGGRALVRLPDVPDPSNLDAFAVSLEAAGGSPDPNAPAGPVVMVGSLGT